jgi:hypothetical protein
MQARTHRGRYDYMDMDLMCVCGHRLGVHAGVNDTNTRPCFNEDAEGGGDGKECACKNFKPKKKPRR